MYYSSSWSKLTKPQYCNVYIIYYILYIIHYILYIIQYTLYIIHYTIYIIYYTLYNIHYTIYIIHYTLYIIHYTLYIIHYTLYNIHYTLYNIHYTLYIQHFTLYKNSPSFCFSYILNCSLKGMFFYNFLLGFIILFIQYASVICRLSDHTVGRLRAEIRTRAGWLRGRDTTPRPPRLLWLPPRLLSKYEIRNIVTFILNSCRRINFIWLDWISKYYFTDHWTNYQLKLNDKTTYKNYTCKIKILN